MKFANTHMLFLVWVLPLLALAYLYGLRKRRTVLREFADARALGWLMAPGIGARRRLRAVLVLGAVLLIVIAMAGPQYGFHWQETERRGVDLVIALDCSRSMLAQDIAPTRLARAKREIIDLLGMLQGDRVGLVAYSGSAFLQCPLTLDYAAFDLFLHVLTPDYLPMGGTDLSAALRTALTAFDPQSAADKAIILITDGEHTGRSDPQAAAEALQKAGIKLFCIGVGSAEGVPVPAADGGFKKDAGGQIVLTRLDEALLTRMAVVAGGVYVRSEAGDMDLDVIYRERIRGGMQHATLESGRKQVWADRYQWPLGLALLLLVIARAVPVVKKPLLSLMAGIALMMPAPAAQAGPLQDGYSAYQQGRYEEARRQFVQGQLKSPDDPEVLYNLGNAYYKTGDYDAAQAHYSQALSGASDDLKAKLLYNMGNAAYRRGALREAVRNYQAALQLSPEDQQARENLAFVEKQLQQHRKQQPGSSDDARGQPQANSRQDAQESDNPSQSQQDGQHSQPQPGADPNQEPNASQYGSQMPDSGENAGREPAEAQPQKGSDRDGSADEGPMPPSSAAQILNRLKDEPGRAMMPAYTKQPVDKDW